LVFTPIQVASKALSLSLVKSLQEDYLKLSINPLLINHHNLGTRAIIHKGTVPLILSPVT